ncbi:hypothetical protein ABPG72_000915 [Tetrahymena utriculariae]
MIKKIIASLKYFSSHSITPSELQPGDHIYVWRNVRHLLMYQHHGVYIGNGRCIHFTTRADALAYDDVENKQQNESDQQLQNVNSQQITKNANNQTSKNDLENINSLQQIVENTLQYDKKSKNFHVVNQDNVDLQSQQKKVTIWDRINPQSSINKAVIMETSLDYFLYGGKLKRARYNCRIFEYLLKSAGTCYRQPRLDGQITVEIAKKYICPINAKGQKEIYSLKSNNCEHLVLEWTTGVRKSYQLERLLRRSIYSILFFFPIYKINDHFFISIFDNYIKVSVFYETLLSNWVYVATFLL